MAKKESLWTESEISFLRENYTRLPIAAIAAQLGRNYEAVRHKAGRIGIRKREWHGEFTPEEDEFLRERYARSPMSEMTALLGRHHNSIRQHAHRLGLVNGEQVRLRAIASAVRHDYFAQIDSPVKAYVLGLMATDGCVGSGPKGRISFKVAAKDRELAELVRDEISPQSAIGIYAVAPLPGYTKVREVASFAVGSPRLRTDLASLGVVPRKTFILRWPDLQPGMAAPFILGCFDGDGHLAWKGSPWRWRWNLYSASEPFLAAAHEAIRQQVGLDLKKDVSKRGLHELRLNGGQRIEVLDAWLHADVPGLGRKRLPPGAYAHAEQEILARRSEVARRQSLPSYAPEQFERARHLRALGHPWNEIAIAVGVNRSTLHKWIKRESQAQ